MKKEENKLKKLLYRSFDETLTEREQQHLAEGLEKFPHLQEEKESVASLRNRLSEKRESFSAQFEDKLMDRIRAQAAPINIFSIKPVFRTVALSGVAAIIVVLISVYFIDGSLSLDSILGINGYSPDMGMLAFF